MFCELDVVRLKRDIPTEHLTKGQEGTVHEVAPGTPTMYLVEFVNDVGQTLVLAAVEEGDLELVWSWMEHPEAH